MREYIRRAIELGEGKGGLISSVVEFVLLRQFDVGREEQWRTEITRQIHNVEVEMKHTLDLWRAEQKAAGGGGGRGGGGAVLTDGLDGRRAHVSVLRRYRSWCRVPVRGSGWRGRRGGGGRGGMRGGGGRVTGGNSGGRWGSYAARGFSSKIVDNMHESPQKCSRCARAGSG